METNTPNFSKFASPHSVLSSVPEIYDTDVSMSDLSLKINIVKDRKINLVSFEARDKKTAFLDEGTATRAKRGMNKSRNERLCGRKDKFSG